MQQVYQASWHHAQRLAYLLAQLALYVKRGPGLYQQALALEHASLAIYQQELGEEHPSTLATMHNLATSLRQLGDAAAARKLEEQVLAIRRRVQEEEHPDTLGTMHTLAMSFTATGRCRSRARARRTSAGNPHPGAGGRSPRYLEHDA